MQLRSTLTLVLLLITPSTLYAQFGMQIPPCEPPSTYATNQWNRILEVVEYNEPIQLCSSAYVPNAMAISYPTQQFSRFGPELVCCVRLVYYNPTMVSQLDFATGNEFAALSLLAHELGHHVRGEALQQFGLHPWVRELEADYYSGYALAKLGATPADLQVAQRLWFSMWGSPTHPDSFRRIARISEGWEAGGGEGEVESQLQRIYEQLSDELARWFPGR